MQNFLRDLLKEASKSQEVSEDKLIEYTDTMVSTATALSRPPLVAGLRFQQGRETAAVRDGQVRGLVGVRIQFQAVAS